MPINARSAAIADVLGLLERDRFAPLSRSYGDPHLPPEQLCEDLLQGRAVAQSYVSVRVQEESAFGFISDRRDNEVAVKPCQSERRHDCRSLARIEHAGQATEHGSRL